MWFDGYMGEHSLMMDDFDAEPAAQARVNPAVLRLTPLPVLRRRRADNENDWLWLSR